MTNKEMSFTIPSKKQVENFITWRIPFMNERLAKEEELKDKRVDNLLKQIHQIPFVKLLVEMIDLNTVKFTLVLNESLILSVIKPFNKTENVQDDDVIFNLYRSKELLVSDVTKIDDLVKAVKDML